MPAETAPRHWQIADATIDALADALAPDFAIEADKRLAESLVLYDSFNRSLSQAGLALLRSQDAFSIALAEDLRSSAVEGGERPGEKPVFWQDFPDGGFRKVLRRHLGLRAATALVTLERQSERLLVRNRDGKIVSRAWVETLSLPDVDQSLRTLSLSPLLGYEDETAAVAQRLDAADFLSPGVEPAGPWALRAAGKDQPPLSPKEAIRLDPSLATQQAVAEIARGMIRIARQTETGIVEDIDSEFLHDYRVSIRKIRSVLTLIKGAFPKKERKRLKAAFGALARDTNRLRDLDVYLIEEPRYRSLLPPELQPGLDRVFADVRKRRAQEKRRLKRRFQSAAYQKDIAAQQQWFDQPELPKGKRAERPVLDVASEEIYRHFKQVRAMGAALETDTPDDEVHALRIECKKLRYLLELFSSLFPSTELKAIGKKLKRLQNTLGAFNDYAVQAAFMNDYLHQAKELDRETAAAVGGLIAELHRGQRDARQQVAQRFAAFNRSATKQRFQRLFRKRDQAAAPQDTAT